MKNKKLLVFLIVLILGTGFIFADETGVSAEMNNVVNRLVGFFDSGWVKGIACIALIAEAIALIFAGGQNPQIFKKFLPLIAGTVIFMCAGKIVTLVFGDDVNFETDLGGSAKAPVPIERDITFYS